ncbi:uncharacterized protein A4U43_C02F2500 [Asparagus officinalis]|uniref:FCP1 homology domain-containing protein n=1 Tax=Asparagus officinalis TaxID=4686 RepID=A0A5P1FG09_ASPOF|nr:uncharacterized protein A4U43_C02F2500 [Asparagus officinalis]
MYAKNTRSANFKDHCLVGFFPGSHRQDELKSTLPTERPIAFRPRSDHPNINPVQRPPLISTNRKSGVTIGSRRPGHFLSDQPSHSELQWVPATAMIDVLPPSPPIISLVNPTPHHSPPHVPYRRRCLSWRPPTRSRPAEEHGRPSLEGGAGVSRCSDPDPEVVLDLDETLVCAYESSSLPAIVRNQAIEAGLKCFELECLSVDKDVEGKQKVNHVTVFERPGLHEFLHQTSEFADLVLFTAGLEGYARPLVDKIDVGNRFSHRLYRPATVSTEYREHVKDLSCISKDLCRIVIVDNNPFSFLLQPLNGIPCIPFSAGQPYDGQLMGVLLPLLKHLSLQKDVRPVLYERFHMPEWFQKHGIPSSVRVL